jgi:hypothetical protein
MMLGWPKTLLLVGLDLFYLALFLGMGILLLAVRAKFLRVILWLLLLLMAAVYLIDSFVILALDEHASLFDIGRYALEPGVISSFLDVTAYLAIILFLLSMLIHYTPGPTTMKLALPVMVTLFLIGGFCEINTPRPLARYAMLSPSSLVMGIKLQKALPDYTAEQIAFYSGQYREPADIPPSRPDIILLVIESLSSINSRKASGSTGFMDDFDELAEEGTLFRNFFANHQASEGGLIALLSGFPPMHFPTATPYMFDEFAIQPSIISEYREMGYFTEFLTNSDLGFIGLNHYLDGLEIDRSRGRDEIDAMRMAPRVVLNAPSDALLYAEGLVTVQRLSNDHRPFILTLATTSTHLPYTHPEGGENTPRAVWDWSLRQLNGFFRRLSESGFFENGILLITGDHRQMRPVSAVETETYGDSARARVPLLVIGDGYAKGAIDDRFFQQSDLLRMLGKIRLPEKRLSPQPIWVERYNRKYGRIELIDRLSIFDEADQGRREYRLKAPGNLIEWLDEKPAFSRRLEALIHAQRSSHQMNRSVSGWQAGEEISPGSE